MLISPERLFKKVLLSGLESPKCCWTTFYKCVISSMSSFGRNYFTFCKWVHVHFAFISLNKELQKSVNIYFLNSLWGERSISEATTLRYLTAFAMTEPLIIQLRPQPFPDISSLVINTEHSEVHTSTIGMLWGRDAKYCVSAFLHSTRSEESHDVRLWVTFLSLRMMKEKRLQWQTAS